MLDWKQRLYAFLLRKVVGPFLDDHDSSKLHDSIDVSLHDGVFVFKNVSLNALRLSETSSFSGFSVKKAMVRRLEIKLSLSENTGTSQSSLVWKAWKLGGSTENGLIPTVSLVAEIHVCGLDLELYPVYLAPLTNSNVEDEGRESGAGNRSRVRSFLDAVVSSTMMTLKLSDMHIKIHHQNNWISLCLASATLIGLLSAQTVDRESITLPTSTKSFDFSDIIIRVGGNEKEAVVALAKGSGRVFVRIVKNTPTCPSLHNEVEASLNHQLNFSFDTSTLRSLLVVATGFSKVQVKGSSAVADLESNAPEPSIPGSLEDEEDLVAINGIMKQYHEAYHLAQTNQCRGGVLIPTRAYMADLDALEEDDGMTFDVFWDAQEQCLHDKSSTSEKSVFGTTGIELSAIDSSQLKVRLSLLSVSFKISFRDLGSHTDPQEYVLATLDNLQMYLLKGGSQSEFELTVGDFALEDAQLVETDRIEVSKEVDIGTIVSFDRTSNQEEDFSNQVTDPYTPCLRLNAAREMAGSRIFESEAQSNSRTAPADMPKWSTTKERITVVCQCPSLVVSVPLVGRSTTAPLFDRCGETILDEPVKDPCLSLLLDTLEIRWNTNDPADDSRGVLSSARLTAWHVLLFASAPIGDDVSIGYPTRRVDLMLMNARTEIEPCIPISLEFKIVSPPTKNGRESFPLVPMISSFKARQNDEDGKIDQLMDSIFDSTEPDWNLKHNANVSQIGMLSAAEESNAIVSLRTPEIVIDITDEELVILKDVLDHVTLTGIARDESQQDRISDLTIVSLSFRFDQISISLKPVFCIDDSKREGYPNDKSSFLFVFDTFQTHCLIVGSSIRQMRVLLHDTTFYSALHTSVDEEMSRAPKDTKTRVKAMKQRILVYKEARLSAVVFRSKFFTPICNDIPSFLMDIQDTCQKLETTTKPALVQMQINLTFYHLTLRYDPDSDWLSRLVGLFPGTAGLSPCQHEPTSSMTRVFVSFADCNVDYTSPSYFCTASRSVLRVGDLRFASNFVVPSSRRQAFSLSAGDVSCFVANERISRTSEDMKLCMASVFLPSVRARPERTPQAHGITAEALLREVGFAEILNLDSADAVVVTTNDSRPSEARVAVDLSLGLLSMSACKDSFRCFSASVVEIQAKLAAVSEVDFHGMKQDMELTTLPDKTSEAMQCLPLHKVGYDDGDSVRLDEFLLDGYDWTEVDHDPLGAITIPAGAEQAAGWFSSANPIQIDNTLAVLPVDQPTNISPRVIPHHFPLYSPLNLSALGNMGAGNNGSDATSPQPRSRLVVHKVAVRFRFHDGYDWPAKISYQEKNVRNDCTFVVAPLPRNEVRQVKNSVEKGVSPELEDGTATKRGTLLATLLDGEETFDDGQSPFDNVPLPEERARAFDQQSELRRFSKRNKVYLQLSANGISLKLDAYTKSKVHRLLSVLVVSIPDMFLADATSASTPVKMLGEWINDNEHPRDTRCGLLMLKMITWIPVQPLSADGEIQSDECEVTMQFLPMRAIIDQRAIQFAQGFFHREEAEDANDWRKGLHLIPPPRFRMFRVKKWKLKVDYIPQKLDVDALRDGCVVELINLSPINGMVIVLSQATAEDATGFSDVVSGLTRSWLQEIVSTQLYKFLANARPFEPISDVGQGITDLVVLPYEALKNGDEVSRAVSSGMKSLAGKMAFQALTTSSLLTEYAASRLACLVGGRNPSLSALPTRPAAAPKGVQDVTAHAMESLARGLQAANYKIVIVPYREFSRHGAVGAAKSVVRGIPVMLIAPVTGAAEALSYTLLGARNALRPDVCREEEASRTGFTNCDI